MKRGTSARVAGAAFLAYIAIGVVQMLVSRGIPAASGTAERLLVMGQHTGLVKINMILGLTTGVTALILGVALYGITRDVDHEIALLALAFRIGEGLVVVVPMLATMGLLWLASGDAGTLPADAPGIGLLAGFLVKVKSWNTLLGATFFSVGSVLFSWLLWKGWVIPRSLAMLGVVSSVILMIGLPLQLTGVINGLPVMLMWIPMALFEIPLGVWLLVKAAGEPRGLTEGRA